MSQPFPTIKEIRESFNQQAGGAPASFRFVFRPVSFPLTWVALRAGVTANGATWLGLLAALIAGYCFIGLRDPLWLRLGVAAYFVSVLLDLIDGNIARIHNSATYYGKYLDGAVDVCREMLLPLCLGVGLFLATGDGMGLMLGITAAFLFSFASFCVSRLSFFLRWIEDDLKREGRSPSSTNPLDLKRIPMRTILHWTGDARYALVFLSGFIGLSPGLFYALAGFVILRSGFLLAQTWMEARTSLNVSRCSRSAASAKRSGTEETKESQTTSVSAVGISATVGRTHD